MNEPDETFTVSLSASTNAAIATPAGTGTIQNDDLADVNVTIAKTASSNPFVGQPLTYTLTVNNTGAATATSVVVTDVLPANVSLTAATPSQGTCVGTTTVTCTLGALASGAAATITLQVMPVTAGPTSNTATLSTTPQVNTAGGSAATVIVNIAPASAIPTLSELGLLFLMISFAFAGVVAMRQS